MRLVQGLAISIAISSAFADASVASLSAQIPVESEVRQIVTFTFLPGQTGAAIDGYRSQAIPLYERNEAMLSFRAFREVESPIPLDLIVVSAFRGMAGMDDSNSSLRELAAAGTSIGAIYGQLGALSSGHTDQFVEMLPALGSGDPSSTRLTAFVWYQILPGQDEVFETVIRTAVAPWEDASEVPSATGRFLVSDGWHYLRFLGFNSLGEYQEYWSGLSMLSASSRLADLTVERREVIVSSVTEMAVR